MPILDCLDVLALQVSVMVIGASANPLIIILYYSILSSLDKLRGNNKNTLLLHSRLKTLFNINLSPLRSEKRIKPT